MVLKLLIDDRESNVIPHFNESYTDIEIEVKRMQIGDYAITNDDKILFIIERKSWKDLSASIKDGRTSNINKLISLREQTNCKILYLIEGKSRMDKDTKIAHIPYKNLLAHLDHIMIRDGIHIIYSKDVKDTPVRLIEFMTNLLSLDSFWIVEPSVGGSTSETQNEPVELNLLTKVIHKTETEVLYNIWSQIPNITTKTASLFIDNDIHISDLFLGKISKKEISILRYTNGTIIGKRADKIIKVIDNSNHENHKHYCNILAELPMITKKTAALILMKATFNELVSGSLSITEISNIRKTENKKIGKTAAEGIYKYLIKQI
jgi:ERCC4-type nuclease